MISDDRKTLILNGMRRRLGMSPEKRAAVDAATSSMVWTARCPKCHAELQGTPDELKAHHCE